MKTHLWILSVAWVGCGVSQADVTTDVKDDPQGAQKQEERWSSADSPALFTNELQLQLAALPKEGEATNIPWAGNYWPIYEDNINVQWDGATSDSAAMKYQKAFGGTGVEDAVSKYHGIDAQTAQKECKDASECNSALGETCGKRRGKDTGRCIPTWWGICHAWTPASILLPEPKHPVTRNGVTFKVQDLKALGSLVHNSTRSKFVSLRCNKGADDKSTIAFDDSGRPTDANKECRDTNPGTYHLLLTNYLGVKKLAFVEDRTFNHEVWNQPLRGFKVLEQRAVSATEANTLIGATTVGGTTVKKAGTVKKNEWAHQGSFPVAPQQHFRVRMSGTADADLHVQFGTQPTDSAWACRPYAEGSNEECDLVVPEKTSQAFVSVKGYADASSFELSITTGGSTPTTYQFDPDAKGWAYVKTEVRYITESAAGTDGNLRAQIDQYTRTDLYEYVLELDAEGKIIGGEWVGSSKSAHPDFVWLPMSVNGTSVAGGAITYANVKSLIDESVTDSNNQLSTAKTVNQAGTVKKGELKVLGPFNVAPGTSLTVEMTGTGDADLYAKKGMAPTLTNYDCRPYKNGTAESCAVAGPGNVYVAINGYAATSDFKVVVKYTEAGGPAPAPAPTPTSVNHLNVSGAVAQGEMRLFELPVPAGARVRVATTSSVDLDLYVQMDTAPTTETYLARGYSSSGNEAVTVTAPSNGTLVIAVHGYQAGSFTLKTSTP